MGDPFADLGEGDLPDDLIAFRHLVGVVREMAPDPMHQTEMAVAAWSVVHGLAALLVDGPLCALAADRARVQALAERVLAQKDLGR